MNTKSYLAIDIGASGGRHILGWMEDGKLRLEEIHRFPNGMTPIKGQLCWDVDILLGEILAGLRKCAESGRIPVSTGIDTWGVDFVLLDNNGALTGPPVAYRDSRTEGMDTEVYKCISESELYGLTGIQKMLLNTIYQLMAVKTGAPRHLDEASRLLFMPDYLHYRLCGVKKTEYTIASTSGLLNAESKTWDEDIIARCGFPRGIFGEIVPAGTVLGGFTEEVKQAAGFDCMVVMPPSHDTASAFLAVPAKSDRSVYISSGTWSLLGVEISDPVTTEASRAADFTNEGGYQYRYRYLKNIMGLWILQSVHKEICEDITFADMVTLARASEYDGLIDVGEDRYFAPESMVAAIREACRETSQAEPQTPGDFARCICRSLAGSYAKTIKNLSALTGTDYDSINIIGGGSQNDYLNEVTSAACGLPVYAGPTEATALGNIAAQMIADGTLSGLDEARDVIRLSFDIREVKPL